MIPSASTSEIQKLLISVKARSKPCIFLFYNGINCRLSYSMFHLIFQHVNVEVISRHDPAGKVTPLTLKWPDGRVFEADRCPF